MQRSLLDEQSNDLGELQDWLKEAKAPDATTLRNPAAGFSKAAVRN
jgi:hypothetical protein